MSSPLRLSEKWFRRGLWLVAFVFAGFLIGLGSTIVGDLPKVEQRESLEDFMPPGAAQQLRVRMAEDEQKAKEAQGALEQAQLKLQVAQSDNQAAKETFNNWLATRQATARADQDKELVSRTAQLDTLRQAERQALGAVEVQQQNALNAAQGRAQSRGKLAVLEAAAQDQWQGALRSQELRVFLYRLALTLPLLAIAGWLFVKQRKSTWWPFVWGFIYFALFAFFVELVPYLPSYGGYVRYIVGIIITALIGRYAIIALNRYLERQKLAEQMPEVARREELSYDTALARLAKGVCPGCERSVDLKDAANDYCPHCGIGLYKHCAGCQTRKSAFAKFCHSCGTPAVQGAV